MGLLGYTIVWTLALWYAGTSMSLLVVPLLFHPLVCCVRQQGKSKFNYL